MLMTDVHPTITRENASQLKPAAETRCGFITELAWSPDGHALAVAFGEGVNLYDSSLSGVLVSLNGHEGPVKSVIFSPDNTALFSGGADMTVRLWMRLTGRQLFIHRGHT